MNWHRHLPTVLACSLVAAGPGPLAAEQVLSGYEFIKPATRAMQDDEFENPGMLAVEQGMELFNHKPGGDGEACSACHGEEGERFDAKSLARYPVYEEAAGEIVTLQGRIRSCRENAGNEPLPANDPALIALETFVRNRAHGEAVNVQTDGPMAALIERGEALFNQRYGLIDMSCAHCHVFYPGQWIRGQRISQGQGNGFPAYRLDIGEMTNLEQRIQQCMTSMRAEPFAAGSDEIKQLGLYMMSRSNGLRIETPAVRY